MSKTKERIIDRVEINQFIGGPVEIAYEPGVRRYCRFPYKNHPNGCPNWGVVEGCPPNVRNFVDVYRDKVIFAALGFYIPDYLKVRREVHADWGNDALLNLRHWQNGLNKDLRIFAGEKTPVGYVMERCPEAMGVNIFETCSRAGLKLIRNPLVNGVDDGWVYKVMFFGKLK
jgi:hypothetical protein